MRKNIKKFLITLLLIANVFLFMPKNSYAKAAAITSNSNYPIVMVHGLFGWGNDELFGENYWGGFESLRNVLQSKGYTVFTPTIGSVSSNWDRACELYAYLKGGTVDYGEAHAKKYGHARYGRTFPGVYPAWGTLSKSNQLQKVHLIGHSMGGQTIRVLTQLLENGDKDEIATTPKETINPLFVGDKHWVDSVTTLATPHDGSQEAYKNYTLEPAFHDFFAAMAAQGGLTNSNNPCLDLKLDQWGLRKQANESFKNYYSRVFSSNIWKSTKDLSIWDLKPEGARELNSWVKAQNDVYYFSVSCQDTHKSLLTGHQIPNINMNPVLLQSSYFMGAFTNGKAGEVKVDSSWWENDGIVSVISAISPKVGSTDTVIDYNGTPKKGVWNYLGKIDNIDHVSLVAFRNNLDKAYLEHRYIDLAKMLYALPQ